MNTPAMSNWPTRRHTIRPDQDAFGVGASMVSLRAIVPVRETMES